MKKIIQENSNNYSIVTIILLIVLCLLTGYNILSNNRTNGKIKELDEKIQKIEEKKEEPKKEETEDTKEDTSKEEKKEEIKKEPAPVKEYVGRYDVIDGDPKTAYIILNDDMTFERNINVCEGYLEAKGTYTAIDKGDYYEITIPLYDKNAGFSFTEREYKFKYRDNKLYLVNPNNEYAYYDCEDSRTFKKE